MLVLAACASRATAFSRGGSLPRHYAPPPRATEAAGDSAPAPPLLDMPTSPEAQVRQAADAVRRAASAGIVRQRVDLMLPLIGATELDDW